MEQLPMVLVFLVGQIVFLLVSNDFCSDMEWLDK